MMGNVSPQSAYLTSRQACDRLGYSRPDSFLRAWRAAGLPVYQRPSGRHLVASGDLERFLRPVGPAHTGERI